MIKPALILAVCLAAAGCTSTNILKNNSVAQKFAAFNKSGWAVSGGGVANAQGLVPVPGGQNVIFRRATPNPFSNPVWNTNFRVDGPNGQRVVGPNNGDPVNLSAPLPPGVLNISDPSVNANSGQTGPVQLR